ncbi:hypothetical protein [Hydrogenovibrio kuenenii]|uniref:hypothetical protein n=1 Tax=Hydrogenovibrio kuenenii TaxID=63658 RepID=UPI0004667B21|nr:hypothetical protein [Hydrogenovibrio kuenenii]
MKKQEITKGLKYFFKKLEKKSQQLDEERAADLASRREIAFDEVESFSRALMTQNIFIHTIGINGKHESTILAKAMFSINKVVRVYYSTSFDENVQGYIRLRPCYQQQLVVVERMHGYRPKPELLYASVDECHVVRYFANWISKRVDWNKTKISNLDLYKQFKEVERQEYEEKVAEEIAQIEALELKKTLDKHFGKDAKLPQQIHSE